MTKNQEIAERLKGIREMENMKPAEMAKACGITVDEYERFENGTKDFPFSVLYNCAKLLNIDLTELVDGENPTLSGYSIVRAGHGMPIRRRESFEYIHVAEYMKNRIADPFVVTAPYSTEAQNKPIPVAAHKGQELDFILQGSLKCVIGDKTEILHAGDCLYYDSSVPHGMIATGGDKCVFLAVVLSAD